MYILFIFYNSTHKYYMYLQMFKILQKEWFTTLWKKCFKLVLYKKVKYQQITKTKAPWNDLFTIVEE